MTETTSADRIATYLAEMQKHHRQHVSANFPAPGICVSRCAERWPCSAARVAAALKAVLGDHGDCGVYLGADECDHPEPSGIDEGWDADHPQGAGDVGRICLLTEVGRYCPACTQLVYEDDPVGDQYVDASNCIVLPVIAAKLLGGGG